MVKGIREVISIPNNTPFLVQQKYISSAKESYDKPTYDIDDECTWASGYCL